ncbi:MAG: hypothetical protein CM1200mP2_49780 [Planctomycetaceae bacterium]|nr:MAG: hypothetical protein CM1200mP2_49780 [Planctomycetaceae bacterium]
MLDTPCHGLPEDSLAAARALADRDAAAIVVLGGDGTHRVVAKGSGDVPLVPISTGTNNVWPRRNEGTLAGMAAALVADERVPLENACRRTPRLDVLRDGQPIDMALVDVAACDIPVPGARAIWDIERIHQLVLSMAQPGVLGLSAIGGSLPPPPGDDRRASVTGDRPGWPAGDGTDRSGFGRTGGDPQRPLARTRRDGRDHLPPRDTRSRRRT